MNTSQTKTEQALIQLDKINAKQIVEVSKWEKVQKDIIKENPFIEITDTATYNQAKSNRTALLKARTSLLGSNGQEGVIRSTFKNLLTGSINILQGLADMTEPHYSKQQEEVKRYEAIIEEKRLERVKKAEEAALAEEKRILDINNKIDAIHSEYKNKIVALTFDGIIDLEKDIADNLTERDVKEFEEFEITYYKALGQINELLKEQKEILTTSENQRLEGIRLTEERKKFEEEKALAKEEGDKKQAIIDAENKKKADEQAEKQRLIDAENEAKAKKLAEQEAEIKAEQERLQKIEDDRLEKIRVAKEEKQRIANEKKEAKRLKALQPDKDKAIEALYAFQNSISADTKDSEINALLSKYLDEVTDLKEHFIKLIQNLK